MNILILIDDAPHGTEKSYNGFRLAIALQNCHSSMLVNVFLMADATAEANNIFTF